MTLTRGTRSLEVSALVDSGSTINVLPYTIGGQLGLVWEDQEFLLPSLVGVLQDTPAFGVLVKGQISPFAPVTLAFAWTHSDNVPLLLGQVNFFSMFDVCFFGARGVFEIVPKTE
jgi:hypothetical protein